MADTDTIESRMVAFMDACKRSGIRVTHQRLEIYRAIAESEEHPDVEGVYRIVRERIPTISLDTVYRTLATLEEKGLVNRVQALPECRRYDGNMEDHHHFVCTECGMIQDFSSDILDRLTIPTDVQTMGVVKSRHAELRGVCTSCLAKSREKRKRGPS